MSDIERLMKLRRLASELDIRLHVVSTNLDDEPLAVTHVEHLLGIDVISTNVPHNTYKRFIDETPSNT